MAAEARWDGSKDLSSILEDVKIWRFSNPETLDSIPDEMVQRCWNTIEENDGNDDVAVEILKHVFDTQFQRSDRPSAALGLKRLFEFSLRTNGSSKVGSVIPALLRKPRAELHKRMAARQLPQELLNQNPMEPIEACFFENLEDQASHLTAALLLTAYRSAFITAEPTKYVGALYAIREAYAYYLAGAPDAARDSLRWAYGVTENIEPDRDHPQSHLLGTLFSSASVAAERTGDRDGRFDLLQRALRYLPSEGDDRAMALLDLAEEYQRRGELGEAMDLYSAVLKVRKVEDKATLKVAEGNLRMLRAELEGDPTQMQVDPELSQLLGVPGDEWGEFLKNSAQCVMNREEIEPSRVAQGLDAGLKFAKWLAAHNQSPNAFSQITFMLRIGLSVRDIKQFPSEPLGEAVELADQLMAHGDPVDILAYQQLKSVYESHPATAMIRAMKATASLSDILAQLRSGRKLDSTNDS